MMNVDDILKRWSEATERLSKAVSERDFKAFKRAYRDGDHCFKDVKRMIQKGEKDKLIVKKEDVKRTIDQWRDVTMNLKPWMSELKIRLQRAHSNTVRGKKIGRNYKYRKNIGRTLSVKAR